MMGFLFLIFYKGDGHFLGIDFSHPSGVEFSQVDRYDAEKEYLEEALSILNDILYLDQVTLDEDRGKFYVEKNRNIPDNPSIFVSLDYLVDDKTKARLNVQVSNKDAGVKLDAEEVDEHYTTNNGTEVFLEEKYDIMFAYFEVDGLFYTIEGQNIENSSLTWDSFKNKMDHMGKSNSFAESFKTEAVEIMENTFVMPTYFASNLDLTSAIVENTGIELKYMGTNNTTGKKGEVRSSITYSVNDEPFHYETRKSKTIDLSKNTKGDLIIGYDRPVESSSVYHQNVLFFEQQGLYFQIHTSNIETPINTRATKQLKKIANSVMVD